MKYLGKIITVVAILVCAWMIYTFFQSNAAKYEQYEHAIDSLSHEVTILDSVHVKQDSVIVVYQDSIVFLDNIIEVEKTKIVTVEKKYKELRDKVHEYHPTEIDSFFKSRYNY
jgi:hypothetical protein